MLPCGLMSGGNTEDLTNTSDSFGLVWMNVTARVCLWVNVSLCVTCLCARTWDLGCPECMATDVAVYDCEIELITERVRRSCADINKGSGYTSEPPPLWLHPFFTLSPPTNVCLPPSFLLPFLPCLHFFPPVFFSTTPSSPFIPMWCKAEVNERRWQSRIESPSFVSDKKSLRVWGCRKRPFSYSP